MKRLGRKGRMLKWAGLLACLLIASTWTASTIWGLDYVTVEGPQSPASTSPVGGTYTLRVTSIFWISDGCFGYDHFQLLYSATPPGWDASPHPLRLSWSPSVSKTPYAGRPAIQIVLPLWLFFTPLFLPTAFLWWLDRRRIPSGHCQRCNYDLTGNVSGVCPECGSAVMDQHVSAVPTGKTEDGP